MVQQAIALLIIIFIVFRLIIQKRKGIVNQNEFLLWLFFWIAAALSVIFLKSLDKLSNFLGFSSSGIQILLYFSILFLLYLIFRLRLRLEKAEKNITRIVREIALKNKQ